MHQGHVGKFQGSWMDSLIAMTYRVGLSNRVRVRKCSFTWPQMRIVNYCRVRVS